MRHIQDMIPKAFQGHDAGYDVAYFRSRIPALNEGDVSDAYILRHRAMLLEYLRQRDICAGCTGFQACGKQGDMQGFTQDLETNNGYITPVVRRCAPYELAFARQRVDRYGQMAGMMELDEDFRFDNFPAEQARKYPDCMKYAADFARNYQPEVSRDLAGLYLFGPPGVGKTHLMFAVFNALRARGVPCLVVRSDSLFDKMRHMIADGQDLELFLETLSAVPVLGIDEFGQERANDFTMEKLFRIINHRFHAKRPTWFTSNYAPPSAYRRDGEDVNDTVAPLRSRVMNMSVLVKMDGEDARQRNLKSLT